MRTNHAEPLDLPGCPAGLDTCAVTRDTRAKFGLSGVKDPGPFRRMAGCKVPARAVSKRSRPPATLGRGQIQSGQPKTNDPNLACLPEGMPRFMFVPLPMEILQLPERVIIIHESMDVLRQIYMNRKHRDDLYPTYAGDSIGKWEGDTLVVDTIGFNDKTWVDSAGLPHSEAMHVIERIHRADHETLVDDMTIEDPKAFTKPITAQQVYKLKPGWEIQEYVCEENNKYGGK